MVEGGVVGRVAPVLGLAAGLALGCVAEPDGREPGVAQTVECEVDLDALMECADETCDLEALEAQFASCQVGDKADGFSETWDNWVKSIQERLASHAKACYEAKDAACLERVYYALAAGAYVKGLYQASAMMWNFLACNESQMVVDPDTVRNDPAIVHFMAQMRHVLSLEAQHHLDQGAIDAGIPVESKNNPIRAESGDIWYAMGRFTVHVDAYIEIRDGKLGLIEIEYTAVDRYDWHAGLAAKGQEAGVQSFQDNWAVYLVEQKAACEFDMGSRWTETMTELELDDPSPDPSQDGNSTGESTTTGASTTGGDSATTGDSGSSSWTTDASTTASSTTGDEGFACNDGTKIPWDYVCDDIDDCPMSEDEQGCVDTDG